MCACACVDVCVNVRGYAYASSVFCVRFVKTENARVCRIHQSTKDYKNVLIIYTYPFVTLSFGKWYVCMISRKCGKQIRVLHVTAKIARFTHALLSFSCLHSIPLYIGDFICVVDF